MISSYVGEKQGIRAAVSRGRAGARVQPTGYAGGAHTRRAAREFTGFYTKVGAGTLVAEGKETRNRRRGDLRAREGLVADVSLVKAWKGDTEGNLIYRKTARNFNPTWRPAARVTVAEVEELVEPGTFDPDYHPYTRYFRATHYPGRAATRN